MKGHEARVNTARKRTYPDQLGMANFDVVKPGLVALIELSERVCVLALPFLATPQRLLILVSGATSEALISVRHNGAEISRLL